MIIKCKMCGGDIEFIPGATYGTCEYCGSTSTIPRADDEGKLNRYNRANHFRRQCEFDKAVAAYEKILEQDDTDAEAHWGAVISRFGIEYVEDPATGKRIPTCHRVQLSSILADEDYKAAVQYAPDTESRRLYEEEAARIAEIQKGILAISQNEKPYDVFICYKETDESGQRTHDSQWAQEVYYGLTEQGYKVFFSRITLEDKLGQEYEPYIFAALQSAKVMIVIGSKPEYFNAVWVKNEWSRYLALMAKDRKRLLIPCYRGMDPYDLPDELSSLQSQDMSKIGFMQDLLRGIRKVLQVENKPEQPRVIQQVVTAATPDSVSPGVSSLIQRAYLFLEDGDFSSAAEYLDRVLDIDPKYAPAYAGKVCVAFGLRSEAALAETTFQYEDNPDWQKAMRFADPQQKAVYESYEAKVKERVARQIRDYAYDCAVEMAILPTADRGKLDAELAAYRASCTRSTGNRTNGSRRTDSQTNEKSFIQAANANEPRDVSETRLKNAASMFDSIGDAESKERANQCRQLAEVARQKEIYLAADRILEGAQSRPSDLDAAARQFLTVPDYKDAKIKAQACVDEAEIIRSGLYDTAIRAMNVAGRESRKWKNVMTKLADVELNGYRDVDQLRAMASKSYDECLAIEQEAKRRSEERQRREAEAAAAKKKRGIILGCIAVVLLIAAVLLVTLVIIPGINYHNAVALQQAGKYEEAITAFEALNGYSDSTAQIEACRTSIKERDYQAAVALQQAGKYEEAIEAFEALNGFGDSSTQITETKYLKAKYLSSKDDYVGATAIFIGIRGYKDVDSLLENDHNLSTAVAEREAKYAVGNYVTFGHYPQTNEGTDNTPIEWLVLARDGNNALLLSRYGLDAKPYHTESTNITWADCTLRTWLNNTFLNKAFATQEQAGILLTNVCNDGSEHYPYWDAYGGINTQDKIFLLSYAEANKYLNVTYEDNNIHNNINSRVEPTAYAINHGARKSISDKTATGAAAGWWWLRSPGIKQYYAAFVQTEGSLNSYNVRNSYGCVRPALWINLESGIF